jgi:hypothetical protein
MRTRKTALPALDSTRAGGTIAPLARGSRRDGAATRSVAKVTQLPLHMPGAVLPRAFAVGSEAAHDPASPPLDSARTARVAIVRPAGASTALQRHFGELREALQEGWEIVQPIFARPLWSAADDSATAFSFVLRGPSGTRLITVPEGRSVQRFIRDRHLSVDYVR